MDRLALAADKLNAQTRSRLARAIDRCDAALLAGLFHPDATDDHGLFKGTATEFIAWVIPLLKTMKQTQHVIGQCLIEVDGDSAAGERYFVAHHTVPGPDGDLFSLAAGAISTASSGATGFGRSPTAMRFTTGTALLPPATASSATNPAHSAFGTRG